MTRAGASRRWSPRSGPRDRSARAPACDHPAVHLRGPYATSSEKHMKIGLYLRNMGPAVDARPDRGRGARRGGSRHRRPLGRRSPGARAGGAHEDRSVLAQHGPAVDPRPDRGCRARRGGGRHRRPLGRRSPGARAGGFGRIGRALPRTARDARLSRRHHRTRRPGGRRSDRPVPSRALEREVDRFDPGAVGRAPDPGRRGRLDGQGVPGARGRSAAPRCSHRRRARLPARVLRAR